MDTLNSRGQLIDLTRPKVMGIINITTDSFYDGGKSFATHQILAQAEKMLKDGATFLDIGGYSSWWGRLPGAEEISVEEEAKRVSRAIHDILKHFPETPISVDTFRSSVAEIAVDQGAAIVNDISGGALDSEMYKTVSRLKIPYILMHMRGTPKTMNTLTEYDNLLVTILKELSEKIRFARKAGIDDIIIDPGFGFAKNASQSFELMQKLELFQELNIPLLAGVSRKSFIYKTLHITPQEALNGTTAMNMVALLKGAKILRVHDVKEAVECVKLYENLNSNKFLN